MPSDRELLGSEDPGKAEPDVIAEWLSERSGLLDLPGTPVPEDADPG
jgi:hypothetical protein